MHDGVTQDLVRGSLAKHAKNAKKKRAFLGVLCESPFFGREMWDRIYETTYLANEIRK